jgi:phosphoglycolate phosphatase-like HAD superfamily hydrolase
VRAIGVLWGYGSRDELKAADALVASPEAIAPALDALRANGDQRSVWV